MKVQCWSPHADKSCINMKLPQLFLTYLLLNYVPPESDAARILVYIPLPFYSHQAAYRPLWIELANRGHNITLITLNPMENHENITQVDLSGMYRLLEEQRFFDLLSSGKQSFGNVIKFFTMLVDIMDFELSQPNMQNLIEGEEQFDLVITEFYYSFGAAFSHKYKCPLIGVVSMDATAEVHNMLGNPHHPLLNPSANIGVVGKPNFKERILSTLFDIGWYLFKQFYAYVRQDALIKKYFGNDVPPLEDLERKTSLLFINTNPAIYPPRPLTPRTINVGGGLHIGKPKALPKDILQILDQAPKGVVYFSLGSSIRSSQLSNNLISVIVETFAQLPYQILWKFDKDVNNTFVLPKNVLTCSWVPQQDVLRHPNTKVFITHGGLHSVEEAMNIGVPVVVLPFFGDQLLNARKIVEHGIGMSLDHTNLEVPIFKNAIEQVLSNHRYKDSAKRLAKQLSDKPMTSLEKGVWWIEYVLRNDNVDLLRNPGFDIPFYQYCFLDIIFCVFCVCVLLGYAAKIMFKLISYLIVWFYTYKNKVKFE